MEGKGMRFGMPPPGFDNFPNISGGEKEEVPVGGKGTREEDKKEATSNMPLLFEHTTKDRTIGKESSYSEMLKRMSRSYDASETGVDGRQKTKYPAFDPFAESANAGKKHQQMLGFGVDFISAMKSTRNLKTGSSTLSPQFPSSAKGGSSSLFSSTTEAALTGANQDTKSGDMNDNIIDRRSVSSEAVRCENPKSSVGEMKSVWANVAAVGTKRGAEDGANEGETKPQGTAIQSGRSTIEGKVVSASLASGDLRLEKSNADLSKIKKGTEGAMAVTSPTTKNKKNDATKKKQNTIEATPKTVLLKHNEIGRPGDWQCPTKGCRNNVPGGCYGSRTSCKLCGARNPKVGSTTSPPAATHFTAKSTTDSSKDGVPFENREITKVADSYLIVGKDIYVARSLCSTFVPVVGMRVRGKLRARLNTKDRYPWRALRIRKDSRCDVDKISTTSDKSSTTPVAAVMGWDAGMLSAMVIGCCHIFNRATVKTDNAEVALLKLDVTKLGSSTKNVIQKAGGMRSFLTQHPEVFILRGGREKPVRVSFRRDRCLFFMSDKNRSCHTSWNKATAGTKPLDFIIDFVWQTMPNGVSAKTLIAHIAKEKQVIPFEKSLLAYLSFFNDTFDIKDTQFEDIYRGIVIRTLHAPAGGSTTAPVASKKKSSIREALDQITQLQKKVTTLEAKNADLHKLIRSLQKDRAEDMWLVQKLTKTFDEFKQMKRRGR